MAPQVAKSLMKEFRASFRRKKVDSASKIIALKEAEEEELAKLIELKENMGDALPPDYSDLKLLSFLRARSLNVKDAEKLVKLDESAMRILKMPEFKPPTYLSEHGFTGVIGLDKEGSLVRIVNVGLIDSKGIMQCLSTLNIFKTMMYVINTDIAQMEEEYKKTGRKTTNVVYILNLDGLTMSQISHKPTFDTVLVALKLLQDHFHDLLKNIIFVNNPPFFSSVYKLLKPTIREGLQKRIKILDGSWKEELVNLIDADVLPKYLGGERVDSKGDPNCTELIGSGGQIPETFYTTNFLNPSDPDVVVATVPAGATLNFRYPVRQVGSVLTWHIQGKDNDIGVGLFREPFNNGSETPRTRKRKEEDITRFEPLTPLIRSQCHISPEEDSTVLWFTGNVILHFDNSYSWMNSKDIYFKMSVRPPTVSTKNYLNRSADPCALEKLTISR